MKTYTILLEGSQIITGDIQDDQEEAVAALLYQPGIITRFADMDGPVVIDTGRIQAIYFNSKSTTNRTIGF